jgi:hypothetical protein
MPETLDPKPLNAERVHVLSVLHWSVAAHEAKDLRMEMEDLGTTGDGDNKPEAFKPHWQVLNPKP